MPLVPPYIASLQPYQAGRSIEEVKRTYGLTKVIKLASNENPLGARITPEKLFTFGLRE